MREFLQQRKNELNSKETIVTSSSSETSGISGGTSENINEWIEAVVRIVNALNNPKLQTLLEIKSSQRFVDRLTASIQSIVDCIAKCKNSITYASHKQQELHKTAGDVYPQQEKCINTIKLLKQNISNTLSQQYNSRIVNIYIPV